MWASTKPTLTKQYLRLSLLMTVLAMALLWSAAALWLMTEADRAFDHKAEAVAVSVRSTIEDSLAFGTPLSAMRGVGGYFEKLLKENPDIRSLEVSDRDHHPLFGRDSEGSAMPRENHAATTSQPLHAGEGLVGYVDVSSRRITIAHILLREAPPLLAVMLLSLTLAAWLARTVLRRWCAQPFEAALTQMATGAEGHFEKDADVVSGVDELARLSQSLEYASRHIREQACHLLDFGEEILAVQADAQIAGQVRTVLDEARSSLGPALFSHAQAIETTSEASPALRKGPSLKARITLLVFGALMVMTLGMSFAWYYSNRLIDEFNGASASATVEAAWRSLTSQKFAAMAQEAARVAALPEVAEGVAQANAAALGPVLTDIETHLNQAKLVNDIEVVNRDGNVLYGDSSLEGSGFLTGAALTSMEATGEPLKGLGLTSQHRWAVVYAQPILRGDKALGAVVFIFDAETLLDELSAIVGSGAFAVDLVGQPIYDKNRGLWDKISNKIPRLQHGTVQIEAKHTVYNLTMMGVPSLTSGRLGYLLTARDVTEQQSRGSRLRLAFSTLALLLLGTVVTLLFHYLHQAFAPLATAIDALHTLSRGETAVMLEAPASTDEIGRIAAAVRIFRDRTRALARITEERMRRRRRQERLIRQQMLTLAGTLKDGARDALLKDLARIENEAKSRSSGAEVAAELDALAIAFQTMAYRVREQHRELDMMVGELREALKSKTAFIALQQELEIARDLQLSILPKVWSDEEEFDAHALMIPAKEVGGDFYDFFFLSPRRVGMVVADVSGKGVPAALFMAVSRTLLKATATFGISPGACLAKLNSLLVEGNEKSLFVTVFYGILDLNTGVLTYANGGHNPPMRLAADGSVTPLEMTDGIALAVVGDLDYRERSVTLQPNDTLVLYTDGVTEAKSPNSAEFGEERLIELLSSCAGQPSHEINERVLEALQQFADGGPQADDITCLAFHFKGSTPQMECRKISLRNELAEIPRMTAEVESFAMALGVPRDELFSITLSLDEVFTNIVSYSYEDNGPHHIELHLEYDGTSITATMLDDGTAYDPLARAPDPDLASGVEDRAIGGLGIFLVRSFMDEVRYKREDGRNALTVLKRLPTKVAPEPVEQM